MSLPPNDRTLLGQTTKSSSRERLALALRQAVATSRSPAKEAARVLNLSPRGAEMLLRGDTAPRFDTLIEACRQFDDVWDAVRELAGRAGDRSDAEAILDEIARRLRGRRR